MYNVSRAVYLEGDLNLDALKQALNEIASRHEALRTTFRGIDGRPVQVVTDQETLPLVEIEMPKATGAGDEELGRLLQRASERPFNLSRDLMLRAMLVKLDAQKHVLLLTMHHIASDGWSIDVLFRELSELYAAYSQGRPPALPQLPIQYADYAQWHREWLQGEVLERQLHYWKNALADCPTAIPLPTDRPRPKEQTHRGATEPFRLSSELSDALKRFARQERATVFMTSLAAFQTLLYRYSGQADICVGSPIANRTRLETESLIGFFVNTLVLRTRFTKDLTFRQLVGQIRSTALDAFAHQDLPFEKLVAELQPERSLSHSPLFQVVFAFQNASRENLEFPGLVTHLETPVANTAKFDLTLEVWPQVEQIQGCMEYATDLFDGSTIRRMLRHYETLLQRVVANPDEPVATLPFLSHGERQQIVVEWNQTTADYPRDRCIHELFQAQAESTPEAIAIADEDKQLTYRDLNRRANRLAHHLLTLGVGQDSVVGLCLERSFEAIVGLLGILKAGATYLPLDPEYPRERLAFMVRDAGVEVLLTRQPLREKFPRDRMKTILVDADAEIIDRERDTDPLTGAKADTIAYVMYTSGSTGVPKGIEIPHRAVNRLVLNTNYVRFEPSDTVAQVSNLSFDAATFEVWGALLHGARLLLIKKDVVLSPQQFERCLNEQQVRVLFLTPALFNQLAQDTPGAFRSVRDLLLGGEALDPQWVREVLQRDPPRRLLNAYGPTESTTFACCYVITEVGDDATNIPIGRPISNTRVYIVDENLHPVPVGIPGELCISGDGLARGYLRRPELTAKRFVADPFSDQPGNRIYKTGDTARYLPDGNIEFLGRQDHQIKLRGFRIELEEIEVVLGKHAAVGQVVVMLREDERNDKRLVAYIVLKSGRQTTREELLGFLKQKLPEYAVPSAIVLLDKLPLNPNGKVDRHALPAPDSPRREVQTFVAARNLVERQLIDIWERLLTVRPIGINDSFFDLGGHSLLATRLMARIEQRFGMALPLAIVFEAPTIEQLARRIQDTGHADDLGALVTLQPNGSSYPLFCTHSYDGDVWAYNRLARHLRPDHPVYGLQAIGADGKNPPMQRVEEMAAHYIKEIRTVQPQGPYHLGGICFGAYIALEMAQQLVASGQTVALLASFDTYGYGEPRSPLSPQQRVRAYLRSIDPRHPRQALTSALRPLGDRLQRVNNAAKIRFCQLYLGLGGRLSEHLRKLYLSRICNRSRHKYVLRQYPGRITVLQAAGSGKDPYRFWSTIAAETECLVLPGDHSSILREPHVKQLAEALRAAIGTPETASSQRRSAAAGARPRS